MKLLLLAVLVATPVWADECDVRAERIASAVGGTVLTRIGPSVKLRHPDTTNLSIECRGVKPAEVAGSHAGSGSVAEFARVVARTADLALGGGEERAAATMLRCLRAATADASPIASAAQDGLAVRCIRRADYVAFEIRRE